MNLKKKNKNKIKIVLALILLLSFSVYINIRSWRSIISRTSSFKNDLVSLEARRYSGLRNDLPKNTRVGYISCEKSKPVQESTIMAIKYVLPEFHLEFYLQSRIKKDIKYVILDCKCVTCIEVDAELEGFAVYQEYPDKITLYQKL